MFNLALLKATAKENIRLILAIGTVMMFYMIMIIYMYDPTITDAMKQYLDALPAELVRAMNFDMVEPTFTGFIVGYYYGFLIILFPMVMIMILSYRLVNRMVDRGSMAMLLSTPNPRSMIAATQALFSIVASFVLVLIVVMTAIVSAKFFFEFELDLTRFLKVNIATFAYFVALSGITFMISCLFVEAKHALSLIIAVPLFFFVIQMLQKVSDQFEWLKYLTLQTLYQPNDVLMGEPYILSTLVLISVGLIGYGIGIQMFKNKDLPI